MKVGDSFEDYHDKVQFHLAMQAYNTNTDCDFGNHYDQDTFINHLLNGNSVLRRVESERHSSSPHLRDRYKTGTFISTIRTIYDQVAGTGVRSRSNLFDRSCPRRTNALTTGSASFQQKLHSLRLDDPESIQLFAIEDIPFDGIGYTDEDMYYLNALIENIAAGVKSGDSRVFDTSKPCAVCGVPGHPFDNCPVLQDKGAVTKAYIRIVTALRRLLASMNRNSPYATINQLAWYDYNTAMTIASMQTNPSNPGTNNSIANSFVNSIVDLNRRLDRFEAFAAAISSQENSPSPDDDNDSDSVSTTHTNESLNAIQSYLDKSSSRRSDFW